MNCDYQPTNGVASGKNICICKHCGHKFATKRGCSSIHRNCTAKRPLGFGDLVERVIERMGLKPCAKLYEWITGRKCGCDKRKAWLNRMFRKSPCKARAYNAPPNT